MHHDTIYGTLEDEIRLARAAAPAGSESIERLLAPALYALACCDKCDMWNEVVRLNHLRLAKAKAGTLLS